MARYKKTSNILREIQTGRLSVNSDSLPSLFNNIEFRKREELIKPYLHNADERRLKKGVFEYFDKLYKNGKLHYNDPIVNALQVLNASKGINLSISGLCIRMNNILEDDFPKHLINDIFNIFNKDVEKLSFKRRNKYNKARYKIIEMINNPYYKIMTKNSYIKSFIFTNHFLQYILLRLSLLSFSDKESFERLINDLKSEDTEDSSNDLDDKKSNQNTPSSGEKNDGQNNENNDSKNDTDIDHQNNNSSDNSNSNGNGIKRESGETSETDKNDIINEIIKKDPLFDKLMNDAVETINKIDDMFTEEEQENLWKDLENKKNKDIELLSHANIEDLHDQYRNITMNINSVKPVIKKLLDKTLNSFSIKEKTEYEFFSENLNEIENIEFLHPKLRKVFFEDLLSKNIIKEGKINIYIDTSGSMSALCGFLDLEKMEFAKAFVYHLKKINILNEIYEFKEKVIPTKGRLVDILSLNSGGTTNITSVVQHANSRKVNAIVLTDAEDHCYSISPYLTFIGVKGAEFYRFDKDVIKYYNDRGRIIIFDGEKINKVNDYGQIIVSK